MYWIVLGCSGLYWTVLACTGLYWTVLGCTGLYWAVLGCYPIFLFRNCIVDFVLFSLLLTRLYLYLTDNGLGDPVAALNDMVMDNTGYKGPDGLK